MPILPGSTMDFNIGDRVSIIDEVGVGTLINFLPQNKAIVLMDDDFEYEYSVSDLVMVRNHDVDLLDQDKTFHYKYYEDLKPKKKVAKKVKEPVKQSYQPKAWSIDLHIEVLMDNFQHLSNAEILAIQMTRCRSFIDRAMDKGVQKFVLIHGKGEGVLKAAIHHYLIQRGDVVFDDADSFTYGSGATEVKFVE